jgi:hypothetical protein
LGKLTRLLNMHRFHRSDVLDPFRRQAYAIPILIRGEAIDGGYEATVTRSFKVMKFVVDSRYIYFVGFEKFLRFCAFLEAFYASVMWPVWELKDDFWRTAGWSGRPYICSSVLRAWSVTRRERLRSD